MALGIDIYRKFQTVTDWNAVRNHGVGYVWTKLTDGGGIATAGPADAIVNGAKSVGIPVGGYHYAQLSPSPERQAEIFIAEVRRLDATGLVPALDLEAPFGPNAGARDFGIRFCRHVAELGYRPGVYMNNAFAKATRPDQWGIPGLAIWIARYGARPDPAAGHYDVHQYSSSGQVPGIRASGVDLNDSYTNNHFAGGGEFLGALPEAQQGLVVGGVYDVREDLSIPYREKGKSTGRVLRDLMSLSEPIQSRVVPANSFSAAEMLAWIDLNTAGNRKGVDELAKLFDQIAADIEELKPSSK
ncbi:glycoside hydrolase family 25 protein [Amycolatopsis sp. CA-230715]|uniref:glycoside hydrolase family 25 protein n=1 Tax=Amycolatopsis sp. CA-230715 TaxID=2745196 RepID=UPI001C0100ED|nr:glycoside hydrolase family 25 protein [Amycolatopsis sp. CA-230715]QWF83789.1 hypothetical protein HUW46_07232 [Amycolatopsis sp. CA-230715]